VSPQDEPQYLGSLRERLALESTDAERAQGALGEYEHVRALRAGSGAFGADGLARRSRLSRLFWSEEPDGERPVAA